MAEAFWCPASILCGPRSRLQCLHLTLDSITLPPTAPALRLARLFGVASLAFPCIYLNNADSSGSSSRSSSSSNPPDPDPDYALWGLSYGIVSDLLGSVGLPSFLHRRPAELREAHPGLSRRAALPFLTDSAVMNALLPAYFARGKNGGGRGARWVWLGGAVGAALVSVAVVLAASQRRRARL